MKSKESCGENTEMRRIAAMVRDVVPALAVDGSGRTKAGLVIGWLVSCRRLENN